MESGGLAINTTHMLKKYFNIKPLTQLKDCVTIWV